MNIELYEINQIIDICTRPSLNLTGRTSHLDFAKHTNYSTLLLSFLRKAQAHMQGIISQLQTSEEHQPATEIIQ